MSLALSFIAPTSWSIPSSFQHVATAPLTASRSTETFPSLPDSRNKITSTARTRISTKATRSSTNAITRRLIFGVKKLLNIILTVMNHGTIF